MGRIAVNLREQTLDAVVAMALGSVMLRGFVGAMALDARIAVVPPSRWGKGRVRSRCQGERTGQNH